ncbi:hypothetical protein [Enterovirga aerilata]|uniref:Uncharacterized protein n=1 Tax=Enterovirga aerilata TaxID=2730920 RepID=A0A849I0G5_9HYPH|nr:hypothetical protein [Enterovirga sp. DB1703]NNM72832.1 hypothetical protein [Enterovirga sp. DB1703]
MTQTAAHPAASEARITPPVRKHRPAWNYGPRPSEIRAWARRCEERAPEGFGVGPGWPAEIVAEALLLLAEKRERRLSRR